MTPSSRWLQVVAGVLAMTSSLVVLGTLVLADVAGASRTPNAPAESDELGPARPVTLRKFDYRRQREAEEAEALMPKPDFGSFEGY